MAEATAPTDALTFAVVSVTLKVAPTLPEAGGLETAVTLRSGAATVIRPVETAQLFVSLDSATLLVASAQAASR